MERKRKLKAVTKRREVKKIKDIKAADYNPRVISEKQLSALSKAMLEFGDLSGIVVNIRTGNLVGGHQRIKNLDSDWPIEKYEFKDRTGTVMQGYIDTPDGRWSYREVDWSIEKEKAANLAANKHGGDWDMNKLQDILEELRESDMDFELTGFDLDFGQSNKEEFWKDHWVDMPEYVQENLRPFRSMVVHFANEDNFKEFMKLVNQTYTKETRRIWYPEKKNQKHGFYTDKEEE